MIEADVARLSRRRETTLRRCVLAAAAPVAAAVLRCRRRRNAGARTPDVTLEQSLIGLYDVAAINGAWLLGASVVVPSLGIFGAWIGRGGRTDADGRLVANGLIILAMTVFVVALLAAAVGVTLLDRSLLQAEWTVLLTPIVWLGLTTLGVHQVFPLTQLRAGQLLRDAGLLLLIVAALLWFFSQFRGWGIVFFGGILQLVVVLGVVAWFVRVLVRRMRGR